MNRKKNINWKCYQKCCYQICFQGHFLSRQVVLMLYHFGTQFPDNLHSQLRTSVH